MNMTSNDPVPPPPYVFQEYPKEIDTPEGGRVVVNSEAEEKAALGAGASADADPSTWTAAQLRQALEDKGIAYKNNQPKAELLALLTAKE